MSIDPKTLPEGTVVGRAPSGRPRLAYPRRMAALSRSTSVTTTVATW